MPGLAEARAAIEAEIGRPPLVVATGARPREGVVSFAELRDLWRSDPDKRPLLLVFGTGWGLAEEVFQATDHVLCPIRGESEYNHLSVRSAVAIVLDRLFGRREDAP